MPTRIESDWHSQLSVQSIGKDGKWETACKIDQLSANPVVGQHVLEFTFDGDNIIRSWHPGHDVSYIQEAK